MKEEEEIGSFGYKIGAWSKRTFSDPERKGEE